MSGGEHADTFDMIPSRRLHDTAGAPVSSAADRRTSGRLRCQDITTSLGHVLDISAGGMRVLSRRKPWIGVGSPYQCTVHTPLGTFTAETRIARVERRGIGRFEIGLSIENATPEVRQTLNLIARSLCKPYSGYR